MLVNPLFDQDDDDKSKPKDEGYVFQHRKGRKIQPLTKDLQASSYTPVTPQLPHAPLSQTPSGPAGQDAAIALIRQKVAALYSGEPKDAPVTLAAAAPPPPLSKHQQFMQALTTSGKPLAHIQTEWHNYYISLPDTEKHEVWREFYQQNSRQPSAYTQFVTQQQPAQPAPATSLKPNLAHLPGAINPSVGAPRAVVGEHLPSIDFGARKERRSRSQIKKQILNKVNLSATTQKKAKQHAQSLLFGVGMGLTMLIIALFGFFNEVVIAPFIQPSRHVNATPIIVSADSVAANDTPQVIIPKINVQIPVVYELNSTAENVVQKGLEDGVIHYSSTVHPGEQGNTGFFGHSSNNIFNKGKYKFAFVLLHELVPGDTFHLTYGNKVYTYKVFDKKVVPPSEVSVLNNVAGKTATATLITCDPPGTSTNRLVVWGEQISPDPSGAVAPATPAANATPVTLPSEGPTLWSRFWRWVF